MVVESEETKNNGGVEFDTPDDEEPMLSALTCKQLGNDCLRNGNFKEAILHYTQAILMDPNEPIYYSNRSVAYLKSKQYYLALKDAERAIELKPEWPKGYYRRGEVQIAVNQYYSAMESFTRAFQLNPSDKSVLETAAKASKLGDKQAIFDSRIPWVGASVGIIISTIIILCDNLLTKNPTVVHPIIMLLLVIALSICGFFVAKGYRAYSRTLRKSLLEPPADILEEELRKSKETEIPDELANSTRNRYSKAQARQRFRKGKN